MLLLLVVGLLLVVDKPMAQEKKDEKPPAQKKDEPKKDESKKDEGKKDDAGKKELDKLQGTWKVATFDVDGKPAPQADVKDARFQIKGDKYTFKSADYSEEGNLKLDPAKAPPTIDLNITEGEDKGKTQLGIYKIEGETFTACFTMAGNKERPKELKSTAGSMHILVVCKKEK
jgi:uncharacterized protein (TIGR03067 family)